MCVDNADYVDLEPRKIYELLPDLDAAADGMMRVIDDSGEDYLYSANLFVHVRLPTEAAKVFA